MTIMPEHHMKGVPSESPSDNSRRRVECDHPDGFMGLRMGALHPVSSIKSELSGSLSLRAPLQRRQPHLHWPDGVLKALPPDWLISLLHARCHTPCHRRDSG